MSVMILDSRYYQAVREGLVRQFIRRELYSAAGHLMTEESGIDAVVNLLQEANVTAYNSRHGDNEVCTPLRFRGKADSSWIVPDLVQLVYYLHNVDYQLAEEDSIYTPEQQQAIKEMHGFIRQFSRRIVNELAEKERGRW